MGAMGGALWLFLLSTLFSIQILHHHKYLSKALCQQVIRLREGGERGKIFDRNFHLLATNLDQGRWYPLGPSLCHVVGFSNLDDEGMEGEELYYDQYLRGDGPGLVLLTDAKGNRFSPPGLPTPSQGGENLCLTIDADYQRICQEELERGVERTGAKGGSAIIISPATGDILAIANLPSYDPNLPRRSKPPQRRNRAITDQFEPGSTFKLIMMAAALEERIISPTDSIWCENGSIKIFGIPIRDNGKFGWLTFRKVIEKSSNVGVIKVAKKVGRDNLYRYARSLGFGSPTGVDFPGEPKGTLKPPEEWSGLSLASISIGQEVSVTPLQLLNAYSCVANDGLLMQPHFLKAILNQEGKPIREYPPSPIRRAISPSTAHLITNLLVGVVERGTGKGAKIEGIRVAGKTGTAQKPDPDKGGYSQGNLISSFVGYLPAAKPKWAGLVVLDEPKRDRPGSKGAAPVFRRIMERILSREGLPERHIIQGEDKTYSYVVVPNLQNLSISQGREILGRRVLIGKKEGTGQTITSQTPAPGSLVHKGTKVKLTLSPTPSRLMPDLRGMSLRRALSLLSGHNLRIEVKGEGIITAQEPRPGKLLAQGLRCHLLCSSQ